MPIVKRAHLDSKGKRWHIGDDADDSHPDLRTMPYLFEAAEKPVKKVEKRVG